MTAHEEWVTQRTRTWLATRPETTPMLRYIETQNLTPSTLGGEHIPANWAPENGGRRILYEDVDYLAGELEQLALSALDPKDGSIQSDFISDCLSEVDWAELAHECLAKLVNEEL